MKSFILSLVAFLSIATISDAQRSTCSTVHDDGFFERLENNLKRSNETVEKGFVTRFVPVHFHIVTDTDGTMGLSEDRVISQLCKLNERYAESDMVFYIDEISEINNTNLNHRPRLSTSVQLMRSSKTNAMNLFLVTEILQNDGSPSGSAGYYSGGNNDYVVMLKDQLGNDRFTIEHEIGHFFSLPHTHVGWEGDISQGAGSGGYQPAIHGDTVTFTIISGSTQAGDVEVELVDGSNCTTAGDRICDTPPDYGFGQSCGCCTMVYDVWDRNGDKIEPMIDNVMSYSEGCDPFLFTAEQVLTMQSDFDSPFRTYIRKGEVTEHTPIPSPVNVISPVDDQVYDNFNGVLIEWEPMAEAEYFQVNISGTQQLSYQTTDSELYITDLRPNGLYFIDVFGVNKFGTGCQNITRRFFLTGAGSTSVNELSSVDEFFVFPNPARTGDNVYVRYNSTKSMDANIRLTSVNGQLVFSQQTRLLNGENTFELNTGNTSSGLYLLEINTPEGIILEKLIIE